MGSEMCIRDRSETVQMDKNKILAFVLVHGSANSHTAILARMMNIPALIGVPIELESLHNGVNAIVDGQDGIFYLNPDENQIAQAKREYNLEKAAELQYGKLPAVQKQIEEAEAKAKESGNGESLVHESVTEEEIAKIISRWTGIPVSKLSESERQKTLNLDEQLHKRVIGLSLIHI